MHLIDFPTSFSLLTLCLILGVVALLAAITWAPWRALLAVSTRQHIYFAAILCLVLLWNMNITWVHGLVVHPFGITAVTVIFGWHLAVLAGFSALVAYTLMHHGLWHDFPLDFFLTVLIPASVTYLVEALILRHRSTNLFLFLLGSGYVGALLGLLTSVLCVLLLTYLMDQTLLLQRLWHEIVVLVMFMNAEGFLNGVAVAAMTVFAPDLVKTFDNRKYLGEK